MSWHDGDYPNNLQGSGTIVAIWAVVLVFYAALALADTWGAWLVDWLLKAG